MLKYDCHMNAEIVSNLDTVKYVHKYLHKGSDMAVAAVGNEADEIQTYLDARYITATEAAWKILACDNYWQSHTVVRLHCHLPEMHRVTFDEADMLEDVIESAEDNVDRVLCELHHR